ncbi:hypothetical protein WDU94_006714 [Cyamophila willieti]
MGFNTTDALTINHEKECLLLLTNTGGASTRLMLLPSTMRRKLDKEGGKPGDVQKENSDNGNKLTKSHRMVIRQGTERHYQSVELMQIKSSMKSGLHEDHEQAVMEAIEMEAMRDIKLNGMLDDDSEDEDSSEDELKIDEDYMMDDEEDEEHNDENVTRNHQKSGNNIARIASVCVAR